MKRTNKPMKRLSLYLFLVLFTLQTPSQADDIRDFQIEGMSIGDSLLDYSTKAQIKIGKGNASFMKDKDEVNKYIIIFLNSLAKEEYDEIQVTYKINDKKYVIKSIDGVIKFDDNFKGCKKKKNIVVKQLKESFKNAKIKSVEKKHKADKTGKSTHASTYFNLDSGGQAHVWCTNWSDEMQWTNSLLVTLRSEEYKYFLSHGGHY